ncbi:MAG: hypothetical protein ACSLE2_15070, partial [Lysobacterales bacterium]
MPRKSTRKRFLLMMLPAAAVLATGMLGLVKTAQAQEGGAEREPAPGPPGGSISVTWTYSRVKSGCDPFGTCTKETVEEHFSGGTSLQPVDGGLEGSGSGGYAYNSDLITSPRVGCPNGASSRQDYSGPADFVVHAQCSIDNSITGGPDTSQYDRDTSVVEVLLDDYDLLHKSDTRSCEGESESWSDQAGSVGFGCFFYNVDFDEPGTYESRIARHDDDYGTCTINFDPGPPKGLRIHGKVMGLIDGEGTVPISNAKLVLADLGAEQIEKLSESKPPFRKRTTTTDDENAEYEFLFGRCGKPTKMLVASLLWHEGKPEFAVTAAKNPAGVFIPIYQARCVDDDPATTCAKWTEASDGSFEARVDFVYGSERSLADHRSIMAEEAWDGPLQTLAKFSESAFVYYHSYRAMKYFQTLGLPVPWDSLMIRLWHTEGASCAEDAGKAYYDAPDFLARKFPSFGDLGKHLEARPATGAGVYGCLLSQYAAQADPVMPLWHELGHYLQFQMYNAYDNTARQPHAGYANESSNDSVIEGFATYMAMLTNEHYGAPSPQTVAGQNLELDYKVWGLQGVWGLGRYQTDDSEENAVTGILWDLHDTGHEINFGQRVNGRLVPVSRIFPASEDKVALSASQILDVIHRSRPRTLDQLHGAFYDEGVISEKDLDMIFVNHGAFADIVERNYVHDSDDEFIAQ